MFHVSVANEQSRHEVDAARLCDAVRVILGDSEFKSANLSIAVVDDETIHGLNRRYLDHDWPTDVLSFLLDDRANHLEGEIIISADTAAASAGELGWSAMSEQLLYVIHGALHLIGYQDKTSAEIARMRAAEGRYLHQFGCEPRGEYGTKSVSKGARP